MSTGLKDQVMSRFLTGLERPSLLSIADSDDDVLKGAEAMQGGGCP